MQSRRIYFILSAACLVGMFSFISEVRGEASSGTQPIVLPTDPQALLQLLPNDVPHWKKTSSVGITEASMAPTLISRAAREFVHVPPPTGDTPHQVENPAHKVVVELIDTGFDPAKMVFFNPGKDGSLPKGNSNSRRYSRDDCPVYELPNKTGKILLVKVSNRYLVELIFIHCSDEETDNWLKVVNLPSLTKSSDSAPGEPLADHMPHFFTILKIDEINPKNNAHHEERYYTAEEREALLKDAKEHYRPPANPPHVPGQPLPPRATSPSHSLQNAGN